jgi:hypothetical protein
VSGSARGLLLALGASLALAAAVAVAAAPGRAQALRVESAAGGEELSLPADGTFVYSYRQSVYGAMVEEHLRVEGDRIRIVRARSDDRRSLEYFRWPGEPYVDGVTLAQDAPEFSVPKLVLRVSPGAEQTLRVNGHELDLQRTFGATSVVVRPAALSPLVVLLHR